MAPRNPDEPTTVRRLLVSAPDSAEAVRVGKKQFTVANQKPDQTFGWLDTVPFYLPFVFAITPFIGLFWLDNYWLTVWTAFGLIPLLDVIVPVDTTNPTEKQREEHENAFRFKLPLYLWTVAELVVLFLMTSTIASGRLLNNWQYAGHVLSCAVVTGGIGITVSHELFHKLNKLEKVLGHLLLICVNYSHFSVEHLSGHHKRVATPEDPASAPSGMTVFEFYPRSVVGSYISSWHLESRRLKARNQSVLGIHNKMLWFLAMPFIFGVALSLAALQWQGRSLALDRAFFSTLGFFYLQGFVAASLLELINYVEHYGLRREEVSPGVYERVDVTHSWNAPHRVTNALLFKLQRHSDHHAHSQRRYHVLRSFEESPQLPTGYAGMAVLALIPPLWFYIMDNLVEQYNKADDKRTEATKQPQNKFVRLTQVFAVACFFAFSAITFLL